MGIGTVAAQCAVKVKERFDNVLFFESRSDTVMTQEKFCLNKGINYRMGGGEIEITNYLTTISEPTLIVSVSNRYIFPAEVVNKECLTIVNYHGALLPKYPGRNAEAWAIYNGENEGGITWHKVSTGIDEGDILTQVKVPITEKTTSFLLLREYGRVAISSFADLFPQLLYGTIKCTRQQGERGELYLAKMRPNNSLLNPEWDGHQISCFLRAMDYGPLQTMGCPVINDRHILKYSIRAEINERDTLEYNEDSSEITIRKRNFTFCLQVKTNCPNNENYN